MFRRTVNDVIVVSGTIICGSKLLLASWNRRQIAICFEELSDKWKTAVASSGIRQSLLLREVVKVQSQKKRRGAFCSES